MKKFPSHSQYAPTMVANGSDRHKPLKGHYKRITRNPDDDELSEFGDASPAATVAKPAGKRGRPAGSTKKTTGIKKVTKVVKKVAGRGPGRPAKPKTEEETTTTKKTVKKLSAEQKITHSIQDLLKKLTASAAASGGGKVKGKAAAQVKMPGLQIRVVKQPKKKQAKKEDVVLTANGRPKGSLNKVHASAKTGEKTAGKKKESKVIGPYEVTLLRNPVTEFSIGPIKPLPVAAGMFGSIAFGSLISQMSYIDSMQTGTLKEIAPGGLTAALGAAGHFLCKHFEHVGFLKDISDAMFVTGLFMAATDTVGTPIKDMVKKLVNGTPATNKDNTTTSTVTQPTTSTVTQQAIAPPSTKGGAFSLEGYMQRNPIGHGYPQGISGHEGYLVPDDLRMNGYQVRDHASGANSAELAHRLAMNGGDNSAELAHSLAMNGGSFNKMDGGAFNMSGGAFGMDLSGYAD